MGTSAIMDIMMSWLKGVAMWVLSLFNLSGGAAFSPLQWLSDNWLKLFIILMIIGVAADIIIWLVRWRPYWVWFGKKRIIIKDDDFFAGEELYDSGLYDPELFMDNPRTRRPATEPSTIVKPEKRRFTLIERADNVTKRPVKKTGDALFDIKDDEEAFDVSDLPLSRDEKVFRKKRREEK